MRIDRLCRCPIMSLTAETLADAPQDAPGDTPFERRVADGAASPAKIRSVAWSERRWAGSELRAGSVHPDSLKRIPRCAATGLSAG